MKLSLRLENFVNNNKKNITFVHKFLTQKNHDKRRG